MKGTWLILYDHRRGGAFQSISSVGCGARPDPRSSAFTPLVCLIVLFLFAGCSLYQVRQESETLQQSKVLVGIVTAEASIDNTPLIVAAYSQTESGIVVAHHAFLQEPGPYELMVPAGRYTLFAFADMNRDCIYQSDEPAGQYGEAPLTVDEHGGVLPNLNISVTPRNERIELTPGTPIVLPSPKKPHFTSAGVIVELDDPLFANETAQEGYWQPLTFYRTYGGNIYFLEPYDPEKIPVLFVHGAAGSPSEWKYLVATLDSERYQPWFYYYPSGASLKSMADLLNWKLFNLQLKYGFQEMNIVAHSMGGLVVRSFLVDYGARFPAIKKFISISTPWSGDERTELGVKYSPGVVPSWKDMGLQSEFIRSIYRRPLPDSLDFYLFFGHKGNRNPFLPNNDGVVTLADQLDPRAQDEAVMVGGFAADHTGILKSKRLAKLLNNILTDKEQDPDTAPRGGSITVRCAYTSNTLHTPSNLQLYLRPVDGDPADSLKFNMGRQQHHRSFGPVPPGSYQASLLAESFRPRPARIPVTIETGTEADIAFTMEPEGSLIGYIQQPFYRDGNPGGVYSLPAEDISIRSVRLTGPGLERTLTPSEADSDIVDDYLAGRDWISNSIFAFYNLPDGDYTLTVKAAGHAPATVHKTVRRTIPAGSFGIEIRPLK